MGFVHIWCYTFSSSDLIHRRWFFSSKNVRIGIFHIYFWFWLYLLPQAWPFLGLFLVPYAKGYFYYAFSSFHRTFCITNLWLIAFDSMSTSSYEVEILSADPVQPRVSDAVTNLPNHTMARPKSLFNREEFFLLASLREFVKVWGSGKNASFNVECRDGNAWRSLGF